MPSTQPSNNLRMRFNRYALTAWREERGMRKTDLAQALEIGMGYLCDLEQGRRPGTAPLIRKAADVLKVNVLVLIENPNENPNDPNEAAA